jgi:hypothetical protein
MIVAGWRNMTVSVEWFCAVALGSAHQSWRSRGAFNEGPAYRVSGVFRGRRPTDTNRQNAVRVRDFAENEIVAVILALPEPLAILALMYRGIEFGDRQKPIATNKTSLVTEARKVGEHVADVTGREMAILALEHQ